MNVYNFINRFDSSLMNFQITIKLQTLFNSSNVNGISQFNSSKVNGFSQMEFESPISSIILEEVLNVICSY